MTEHVGFNGNHKPVSRHIIRMYQAVEAERSVPGSLFRWAKWLSSLRSKGLDGGLSSSLPVRPDMSAQKVLGILWICGFVWSEGDWPQEDVYDAVDRFMDS